MVALNVILLFIIIGVTFWVFSIIIRCNCKQDDTKRCRIPGEERFWPHTACIPWISYEHVTVAFILLGVGFVCSAIIFFILNYVDRVT